MVGSSPIENKQKIGCLFTYHIPPKVEYFETNMQEIMKRKVLYDERQAKPFEILPFRETFADEHKASMLIHQL